jgi:hypothetical protein
MKLVDKMQEDHGQGTDSPVEAIAPRLTPIDWTRAFQNALREPLTATTSSNEGLEREVGGGNFETSS